jgi:phosphohistidine phosphatase
LSKEVDPDRPLSPEGVKETEAVAAVLEKAGLAVPVIRHSGKTRADQTARILADFLHMERIEAVSGLAPDDEVSPFADSITGDDPDVLIVGHLPYLRKLASKLIAGAEDTDRIAFVNSGVLCLQGSFEGFRIQWYLTPALCLGNN